MRMLVPFVICVLLWACGDTEYVVNRDYSLAFDSASGSKLVSSPCDESLAGRMLFNEDVGLMFICDGGNWVVMNGLDGRNGKRGKDGTPGANGDDGVDGSDAVFCTVRNFGSDVLVSCDADTITVKLDWIVSEGCSASSVPGDSVLVVCDGDSVKVAKNVKGKQGIDAPPPVDLDDELTRPSNEQMLLCNGKEFDGSIYFCSDDSLVKLCEGYAYDPTQRICFEKKLYKYIVDERDGKVYPVVDYGHFQIMAKNLNYELPGSVIKNGDDSTGDYFGRYYTWMQVMDFDSVSMADYSTTKVYKGICPEGFHVPSALELSGLIDFWTNRLYRGPMGYGLWAASSFRPEWMGALSRAEYVNYYGFSATLTGRPEERMENSGFADFWSSTMKGSVDILVIEDYGYVRMLTLSPGERRNLRCVKDGSSFL